MFRFLILIFCLFGVSDTIDYKVPKCYQDCAALLKKMDVSLEHADTLVFEKEVLGMSLSELQNMNNVELENFIKVAKEKELHALSEHKRSKHPICYFLGLYGLKNLFVQSSVNEFKNLEKHYPELPKLKEGIRIWNVPAYISPIEIIDLDYSNKYGVKVNYYKGTYSGTINWYSDKIDTTYIAQLIQTKLLDKASFYRTIPLEKLLTLETQVAQLGYRSTVRDGYTLYIETFKNKQYNLIAYHSPEQQIEGCNKCFKDAHTFLKIWTELKNQIQWEEFRELMYRRRGD